MNILIGKITNITVFLWVSLWSISSANGAWNHRDWHKLPNGSKWEAWLLKGWEETTFVSSPGTFWLTITFHLLALNDWSKFLKAYGGILFKEKLDSTTTIQFFDQFNSLFWNRKVRILTCTLDTTFLHPWRIPTLLTITGPDRLHCLLVPSISNKLFSRIRKYKKKKDFGLWNAVKNVAALSVFFVQTLLLIVVFFQYWILTL